MDNHIEVTEKQDKGFTLVELLIVIVILGILATVTVFAVRGITDQGQQSACAADQKTLEVAVESWYAQHGTSTDPTEAGLVTDGFLRSESSTYNVGAGGTVTPVTGGDCDTTPATTAP
ncbi:MAG: prepilin-type N-terminal cleavage/methylation domain-containing protein [Actinobacteria bacterium]|nr:prepilin-type N-terminal cleavage/methylation domain-containing protein [Actinomycetota bacterium]